VRDASHRSARQGTWVLSRDQRERSASGFDSLENSSDGFDPGRPLPAVAAQKAARKAARKGVSYTPGFDDQDGTSAERPDGFWLRILVSLMLKAEDFFNLTGYDHAELFAGTEYVWEALAALKNYLEHILQGCNLAGKAKIHNSVSISGPVYIGSDTHIEPGAQIVGPAYIGNGCEIRHNAYIRGRVLIGNGCVVGNSSELKSAILLDGAAAPHFAYVGDSILGRNVNLGAGTKLSNLPIVSEKDAASNKRPTIWITDKDQAIDTHLAKLGAILGDGVQTGCNCVLNPGTLVGPATLIYPNVSLAKGVYPPNSLIKLRQQIDIVPKRKRG
jgi:NDP-sugar pyrophosphorylase family protein